MSPAPDWIQHISVDSSGWAARTAPLSPAEQFFIENRERAATIAESSDPNASYSYDDWALCELDGTFYAFNTSGCSCPSPSETWSLAASGSRDEMLDFLKMEPGGGYEAFAEFLRQIEKAGWTLRSPAPAPGDRKDW